MDRALGSPWPAPYKTRATAPFSLFPIRHRHSRLPAPLPPSPRQALPCPGPAAAKPHRHRSQPCGGLATLPCSDVASATSPVTPSTGSASLRRIPNGCLRFPLLLLRHGAMDVAEPQGRPTASVMPCRCYADFDAALLQDYNPVTKPRHRSEPMSALRRRHPPCRAMPPHLRRVQDHILASSTPSCTPAQSLAKPGSDAAPTLYTALSSRAPLLASACRRPRRRQALPQAPLHQAP